jgi:hypothetical protein
LKTMKDPETWPVLPATPHVALTNVLLGTTVRLQNVASELNPDPETVTTVPLVPVVGTTEILAVTLNKADSPTRVCHPSSFAGVPLTVTFHLTLVVAVGPTMKLPVAT